MKIVASELELQSVTKYIVELCKTNTIVAFRGELGSGKTTLIKNICNFLQVKDAVSSPTYSIVNEYNTELEERIFHFDFYRLESEMEAYDIGIEEYFDSGILCLIEWPSKIEDLLPEQRVEVSISSIEKGREYTINQIN